MENHVLLHTGMDVKSLLLTSVSVCLGFFLQEIISNWLLHAAELEQL